MGIGKGWQLQPAELVHFLEAVYRLDLDEQAWLNEVTETTRRMWGCDGWIHGAIYDASNIADFRVIHQHIIGGPAAAAALLARGVQLFTPAFVSRSFRVNPASLSSRLAKPELDEIYSSMTALGYPDNLGINGLDPSGLGVFLGFWGTRDIDPQQPDDAEMNVYRRMAHHLGAAHRCRRRLREMLAPGTSVDPITDAEAVLDARGRVMHAAGPAMGPHAREALVEATHARNLARSRRGNRREMLSRWHPLTGARWTLVDSFERNGRRYVVARENQTQVSGLSSLTDRERQVVAYLAIGQTTKETAYVLGISDATVRVLLARAATKLGVQSRRDLLEHPGVRSLVPIDGST